MLKSIPALWNPHFNLNFLLFQAIYLLITNIKKFFSHFVMFREKIIEQILIELCIQDGRRYIR
jgi:hypothetical protein